MEILPEEEEQIKAIASDPQGRARLIRSIAPSIFGHDKVKEALLLQLVGGVRKERSDGMVTRGDMDVLLIGDPGSGKSQMLKRAVKIAPKARYVSGKGVSGAGLTAAVVKDEFLGGWSLEAPLGDIDRDPTGQRTMTQGSPDTIERRWGGPCCGAGCLLLILALLTTGFIASLAPVKVDSIPFDSEVWQQNPYDPEGKSIRTRQAMLDDLFANYIGPGTTIEETLELLGEPFETREEEWRTVLVYLTGPERIGSSWNDEWLSLTFYKSGKLRDLRVWVR